MEYYTATEAIKRLGIPASTFYHLVSEGKIARLTLPGKRQGLYRKEDVESLAEALEHRQSESREQPVLKAYEQAESPSNQDVQASITQLIERTKSIGQMLEALQVDISNLADQLQGQ